MVENCSLAFILQRNPAFYLVGDGFPAPTERSTPQYQIFLLPVTANSVNHISYEMLLRHERQRYDGLLRFEIKLITPYFEHNLYKIDFRTVTFESFEETDKTLLIKQEKHTLQVDWCGHITGSFPPIEQNMQTETELEIAHLR